MSDPYGYLKHYYGKDLFCKLSIHGFTKWTYWKMEEGETNCIQVRFCRRCNHKQSRRRGLHLFGEWEYEHTSAYWEDVNSLSISASENCVRVRSCHRCELMQRKHEEPHLFGEWKYLRANNCRQEKVCKRCGSLIWRDAHQYGVWKSKDSCTEIRVCSRCSHVEEKVDHKFIVVRLWREYDPAPIEPCPYTDFTYYKCERCGKEKTVSVETVGA